MSEKKYTIKEVESLLLQQRKSDAECLKNEPSMTGFTAMTKVLKNKLVLKKNAIQE